MPRYVIERQFLVPVYKHILVDTPNLEAACPEALDDNAHPWGHDSKLDWDSSRATTIAQVVELPETLEPELTPETAEGCDLSLLLYEAGLELLPIPMEFTSDVPEAYVRRGLGSLDFARGRNHSLLRA